MSTVNLVFCDVKLKSLCAAIGWIGLVISTNVGIVFTVGFVNSELCLLMIWVNIISLVAVILQITASICVIISTKNDNQYFLFPWMMISAGNVILLIGAVLTGNFGLYFGLIMLAMLIFSLPIIILYYEELIYFDNHAVSYEASVPILEQLYLMK